MLFKIKYNHLLTSIERLYERQDTLLNIHIVSQLTAALFFPSREMKIRKDKKSTRQFQSKNKFQTSLP